MIALREVPSDNLAHLFPNYSLADAFGVDSQSGWNFQSLGKETVSKTRETNVRVQNDIK